MTREQIVQDWLASKLTLRKYALATGTPQSSLKRWARAYADSIGFKGNLREFAAEYAWHGLPDADPESMRLARLHRDYLKRVIKGEAA